MSKPLKDLKLLIEVYKSMLLEEQFYVDLFERRISFYSGIIITLISAMGWVYFYQHSMGLILVLSLALIFISAIAIFAAERAADRVSRNITERAKVEQAIGLTAPYSYDKSEKHIYWNNESIIATTHIISRRDFETSGEFIEDAKKNKSNFLNRTKFLYLSAILFGTASSILVQFHFFAVNNF
jgi:hypothetical protein